MALQCRWPSQEWKRVPGMPEIRGAADNRACRPAMRGWNLQWFMALLPYDKVFQGSGNAQLGSCLFGSFGLSHFCISFLFNLDGLPIRTGRCRPGLLADVVVDSEFAAAAYHSRRHGWAAQDLYLIQSPSGGSIIWTWDAMLQLRDRCEGSSGLTSAQPVDQNSSCEFVCSYLCRL